MTTGPSPQQSGKHRATLATRQRALALPTTILQVTRSGSNYSPLRANACGSWWGDSARREVASLFTMRGTGILVVRACTEGVVSTCRRQNAKSERERGSGRPQSRAAEVALAGAAEV